MKGKEKTLRYSVLKFLLVYMMRITIPVNTTSILLINCSSNNWRGYSLKTYQWVLSRIINIRLRYKYTRFFVMNIIPPLIRFLSRYDCIVWLQMVFNLTEFWLYIQALNLMGIETYFTFLILTVFTVLLQTWNDLIKVHMTFLPTNLGQLLLQ